MYVVKLMQEQTIETSDESTLGTSCEIQLRKQGKYHYKFAKLVDEKFDALGNGDEVIVLTASEHSDLLQQYMDADKFIDEHMIEDLKKQIHEQEQTIADLKQMNDNIAKEKDALEKQLEDSIDAAAFEDLQNENAQLKENLETSEKQMEYWQNAHNNLIDSSDALANENEKLIKQNEDLKNKFDEVNNTNKLLNENLIATNTNYKETKQQMQSDFENKEKELKETIEKQQTHIDEITEKYQSLLPSKENIPQKQHYNEIGALKDEIKAKEIEIDKLNNEIETKLATQKSDLEMDHTKEKAQMLVAYNQELNKLKLEYNNLASEYNHLLNGVDSLTRINTFFNGKHNEIKKDKDPVPMLEITSEQLPPSDENVLEYVPKD